MPTRLLVILDTTELSSSPMCAGAAWQILAHRRPAWAIRVLTTEVVVEEAVANYKRQLGPAEDMINRFDEKFGRLLGLSSIADSGRSRFEAARDSYAEKLRTLLKDAGVEVVLPAKVDHMEIVRRSVSRRRPCDANGNGYRDTLNWLTTISLARKYPRSELVFVTKNTNDFQSSVGEGFHEDLLEDLEKAGLTNVRLLTSLQDLAVELVTNLGATDVDLKKAQAALRDDVLAKFINVEVMADPSSADLEAEVCGLPYGTQHAQIEKIASVEDVEVELVGQAGDETSLAKFSAMLSADIWVRISADYDLSAFKWTSDVDTETGLVLGSLRKRLTVKGILTVGNYGTPKAIEVKTIAAPSEDSGVAAYRADKRRAQVRDGRTGISMLGARLGDALAAAGGAGQLNEAIAKIAEMQKSSLLAAATEIKIPSAFLEPFVKAQKSALLNSVGELSKSSSMIRDSFANLQRSALLDSVDGMRPFGMPASRDERPEKGDNSDTDV